MEKKLNVAMFPWLAIGHITPFIHVANELAARGHSVSLLLPAKAQVQLRHLLSLHPNLVTVHTLSVPAFPGLPAGAETVSDIPATSGHLLAAAFDLCRPQVRAFLRSTAPHVAFYDFAHWLPADAREASPGVAAVCFSVVSASAVAYALVPARKVLPGRAVTAADVAGPPPGYPPSAAVLSGAEAESLLFISMPFGEGVSFYERVTSAMRSSDALSVRTCRELEGDLCDYLGDQYGKPVLLTGPVLPTPGAGLDPRWARWLDSFEPGSVVFCAFGSQLVLEKARFDELVLGLEETGYNFLAVVKPPDGFGTVEEALPEGFSERAKGRGLVYGGWVQQTLILSHPAVGCFVSHCGFGSMWESLMSKSQIVLVPHLGDQILNAKLLAGELRVGVEVERDRYRRFTSAGLCSAVRSVMERDSELGIEVKSNHATWTQRLTKPGFMTQYMDHFVLQLQRLNLQLTTATQK